MDSNGASCSKESRRGQQGGVDLIAEDAEGQDEDSSSSSTKMEIELDNFRIEWKKELETTVKRDSLNNFELAQNKEEEKEHQACVWFMKGIEAENNKRFNEAIYFYRRAIQLVPNIEALMIEKYGEGAFDSESDSSEEDDEEPTNRTLADCFIRPPTICLPDKDTNGTHISALPQEVLQYIFQWVISSDLDMNSLEQVAQVCRGFYVCARNQELWRMACIKIWGYQPNKYGSWREMFIYKPRVCFHGVYISKTTYIRYGESSFQDVDYKPCFLIEYFRYLRFFSNNIVLMCTTSDEPIQTIPKLRNQSTRHTEVLSGHFKIIGSTVSAVVKKPVSRTRSGRNDPGEQIYHLELDIRTIKKRHHIQLAWRHYSIHTIYRNGQNVITNFDLNLSTFPPFWFSRVKSFTSQAEFPLI